MGAVVDKDNTIDLWFPKSLQEISQAGFGLLLSELGCVGGWVGGSNHDEAPKFLYSSPWKLGYSLYARQTGGRSLHFFSPNAVSFSGRSNKGNMSSQSSLLYNTFFAPFGTLRLAGIHVSESQVG